MKHILIRSMSQIFGVNRDFKWWQAVLFYCSAIAIGLTIFIIT